MLKDTGRSFHQRPARAFVATILAALLGHATAVAADEVTAKGTVLRGKITDLSGAGITFAPEYGKGSLAIKWESIEDLKSDGAFQIFYGEDQESDTPLQGYRDGKLLIGTSAATATAIDVTTIYSGVPIGPDGLSFADRMRSRWRYWDGTFDLGLNLQQATTDTTGFLVALRTLRSKGPTRFSLGAAYRYGTEKKEGESSSTTQDQLLGQVRGEYDFTPRIYGFASGDATYDGIQHLSIRGVPKLGLGYVIWQEKLDETRRNFLQAEAGGGWVYEKYFNLYKEADNNYFAVAFGALAGYYLPYGVHFDWRLDYLPAVDDFTNDYLLRTEAGLSVPLMAMLSAKFSLIDEYDSTPAEDTDANSLFLTLGLSLGW